MGLATLSPDDSQLFSTNRNNSAFLGRGVRGCVFWGIRTPKTHPHYLWAEQLLQINTDDLHEPGKFAINMSGFAKFPHTRGERFNVRRTCPA